MDKEKETQKNTNLKADILHKIQAGEVEMRSKAHFMLKTLGFSIGTLFVLGVLLYLVSFIMFVLRANGILSLPSFGLPGVLILFSSLPWLLIIFAVILVVIVEILGRHFAFVYRQPLMYSIVGLLLLVGALGLIVEKSPLHSRVEAFVESRQIPLVRDVYKEYARPGFKAGGVVTITEITDSGFLVETRGGEMWTVSTSTQTRYPRFGDITVGDEVLIIGKRDEDAKTIEAVGLRPFDPNTLPPRPPKFKNEINR